MGISEFVFVGDTEGAITIEDTTVVALNKSLCYSKMLMLMPPIAKKGGFDIFQYLFSPCFKSGGSEVILHICSCYTL